jgi:hypothetical protein
MESYNMKRNIVRVIASIIILMFTSALCFVGISGIYTVIIAPDIPLNYYLLPLFLIPGVLLIISLVKCYKHSGDNELAFKLGIIALISTPSLYLIACLDSGRISGLEFMSFIPVIIISSLCYRMLRIVIKDTALDSKA